MNPRLLEKLNSHLELLSDQADQQYTITGVSWHLLATYVVYPEPLDAVIEFRQALRSAR